MCAFILLWTNQFCCPASGAKPGRPEIETLNWPLNYISGKSFLPRQVIIGYKSDYETSHLRCSDCRPCRWLQSNSGSRSRTGKEGSECHGKENGSVHHRDTHGRYGSAQ